jgi:hypothetical protein
MHQTLNSVKNICFDLPSINFLPDAAEHRAYEQDAVVALDGPVATRG